MTEVFAAIVSILFHGLALAMVLYLISVGLSVTMGLMGFINLAHGVFAMAGGYAMTTLISRSGVPFPLALAAAVAVAVVISLVLERLLYRRLYGGDELDQVLLTMGLVFMSVALANLVYFLIVVSVGGLGSIRGPFVAALLLGTADTAFKYLVPELGAFFIYALTMAVLLWRPRGLFGLVR